MSKEKGNVRIGTEELKWVLMNACHAAVCHYDKVIDEDLREGWTADAENMRHKKTQIKTVLDAVLDLDAKELHKAIFGNKTSSRAAEEALSALEAEGIDINGGLLFAD